MRISDWSSDVCSSDLPEDQLEGRPCRPFFYAARLTWPFVPAPCPDPISVATSIVSANWTPTRLPCDQRAVAPSRIPPPNSRVRSEEHTSELQSLMRISYAVFCLKKKQIKKKHYQTHYT